MRLAVAGPMLRPLGANTPAPEVNPAGRGYERLVVRLPMPGELGSVAGDPVVADEP